MRVACLVMFVGCGFSPAPVTGESMDSNTGGDGAPHGPVDAPANFDPATCPSTFTTTIPGSASRYHVVTGNQSFWDLDSTCRSNSSITHLAVLDTSDETHDLSAILVAATPRPMNGYYYVGAVQARNQATPGVGWSWLTGEPITMAWAAGDPDDGSGSELNRENLAVLDPAIEALRDVFDAADMGHVEAGGVCECDGKPMSSSVRSQIPNDPT